MIIDTATHFGTFPLLFKQIDYAAEAPSGFKMGKSERGRWLFSLVPLV